MNTFEVLIGVLLCLVIVSGRQVGKRDRNERSLRETAEPNTTREHSKQVRHHGNRSRRQNYRSTHYGRHTNHNNENLFPLIMNKLDQLSDRFSSRRTPDNENLYSLIMNKLEEISDDLKRPRRPQRIYVPYPVFCQNNSTDISNRFGVDSITFPLETTPPKATTANPFQETDNVSTELCDAIVINCCRRSYSQPERRRCFVQFGCGDVYAKGDACSFDNIQRVLKYFQESYGPSNDY